MEAVSTDTRLIGTALRCGASTAATIGVADIPFRPEFRDMCEMNACGKFGRCWMCPPDIGPIDSLIEQAKTFQKAMVFQTIGILEDSLDIEGMQEAARSHNAVLQALWNESAPLLSEPLFLGAGACQLCSRCAHMDDAPCRFAQRAVASLEAYGIAVSELSALCGMKYNNGVNTVTYFAAVLYNRQREDSHAND